jgi:glycosyltransferase involved in cell wall biosynthesis
MKLIYFTASYPYGIGEQWKANELNVFVHHFDEITVIPYSYAGNVDAPKALPVGVKLNGPLFLKEGVLLRKKDILRILTHRKVFSFLKEFFSKKVYRSKTHVIAWMSATMNSIRLLQHPVIREMIEKADRQTVLSFFWGRGGCEFLPFIDTGRFHKVFVRMHRYDLFEHVNNGYMPYRKVLLQKISIAAPSSVAGLEHLQELYPGFRDKIRLFRLGTLWNGQRCSPSADGVLRIVSCSYLSAVKRVNLMIESLQYVDFRVQWRHVGDGILRQELEELIKVKGVQDKFIIEGMIDTKDLLDYYARHTFDLFVNVSSSEGIPMSIMEVLSLGIPVMATNVGGIGEIVHEGVGHLLSPDPTPREIAGELTAFYNLTAEQRQGMRERAHRECLAGWNVNKISEEVADFLKS